MSDHDYLFDREGPAEADVLALELEPLGVQVSVVEPGNYRSAIMTSTSTTITNAMRRGWNASGRSGARGSLPATICGYLPCAHTHHSHSVCSRLPGAGRCVFCYGRSPRQVS